MSMIRAFIDYEFRKFKKKLFFVRKKIFFQQKLKISRIRI